MKWYADQTQEFGRLMARTLGTMKKFQNPYDGFSLTGNTRNRSCTWRRQFRTDQMTLSRTPRTPNCASADRMLFVSSAEGFFPSSSKAHVQVKVNTAAVRNKDFHSGTPQVASHLRTGLPKPRASRCLTLLCSPTTGIVISLCRHDLALERLNWLT